jgi:hypothetical protein
MNICVRTWRFAALICTALAMAMAFAHLLEMPAKRRYDGRLYLRVQKTLYRTFAIAGAVFETGALVAATVVAFRVRQRRSAFRLTLLGTSLVGVANVSWFAFIAPVNRKWREWTEDTIPADWTRYRDHWEYAHAARAFLYLTGFSLLLLSVLRETPSRRTRYGLSRRTLL